VADRSQHRRRDSRGDAAEVHQADGRLTQVLARGRERWGRTTGSSSAGTEPSAQRHSVQNQDTLGRMRVAFEAGDCSADEPIHSVGRFAWALCPWSGRSTHWVGEINARLVDPRKAHRNQTLRRIAEQHAVPLTRHVRAQFCSQCYSSWAERC
jgi:hypothetical protein